MILHLVRHPPVSEAWQKRCYGQSDPGLSRAGQTLLAPLVDKLAALKPDGIIHSDMKRTRIVARLLAERLGIVPMAQPLWRERDFGAWEGISWHAIYRETSNVMDGMLSDPDHFRPGGGETTRDLFNRTEQALAGLPDFESVVVLSHGGPIACARMALDQKVALGAVADYIIPTGEVVSISVP